MVNIEEHINKMNLVKKQINNSKGEKKLQYTKCLHKLQKQLNLCKVYLRK